MVEFCKKHLVSIVAMFEALENGERVGLCKTVSQTLFNIKNWLVLCSVRVTACWGFRDGTAGECWVDPTQHNKDLCE